MKKITVVYWSGTGNTKKMAEAVAQGAAAAGAAVKLLTVDRAAREDVLQADAVALGCPAMGAEVLEETQMEPFVAALAGEDLSAAPVALFGSFDWGDGQWMRDWEERMAARGAKMVAAGLMVRNEPDEAGLAKCRQLGESLAAAIA